ncbi:MAG: CPBP family intramembrane metalloprotease [Chloroflexi bacterium]|nr:CPBP family intramembrane metalloprotease [Chloroflexota bacterium]
MNLPHLAAYLLVACYLAFGFTRGQKALLRLQRVGGYTIGVCFLLPYLLAVNLHPSLDGLIRFAVALALPAWFLHKSGGYRKINGWHALAVLSLWFPLEPSLFLLPLTLQGRGEILQPVVHWLTLPNVSVPLAPGINLPVEKMTLVLWALYLFTVRHPLDGLGFTWRLNVQDFIQALRGLALFAASGVLLGLAIHFIRWRPQPSRWSAVLLQWLGMYLFVALPEEILFRGIIQNLLTRHPRTHAWASVLAALIFGASHLNNATPGFPVPNWAYMLIATLAGLAYGLVWQRQRKVTASALTHASVNILWRLLFR